MNIESTRNVLYVYLKVHTMYVLHLNRRRNILKYQPISVFLRLSLISLSEFSMEVPLIQQILDMTWVERLLKVCSNLIQLHTISQIICEEILFQYSCSLYNLVTFFSADVIPDTTSRCSGVTTNIHEFISWLDNLP